LLAAYSRHIQDMLHAELRLLYKCTDRPLCKTVRKAVLQCHQLVRDEPSAVMAACPECHTVLICLSNSLLKPRLTCTCFATHQGFCIPGSGLEVMEPSVPVIVNRRDLLTAMADMEACRASTAQGTASCQAASCRVCASCFSQATHGKICSATAHTSISQ